jgi:FkbM family methyltransferase
MLFAKLVGEAGRVVVFEPGRNNLPYLRSNTSRLPQVEIVEKAVSNEDGVATFFEEELTGQNNSLVGDYENFRRNRENAFSQTEYARREVPTTRLDTFLGERNLEPVLVKIDIEGAEQLALEGAGIMLAERRPMLLVEVTRRGDEVFATLTAAGYRLFTPEGHEVTQAGDLDGNICALDPHRHRGRMPHWGRGISKAA